MADEEERAVGEVVAEANRRVLTLTISYDPASRKVDVSGPADLVIAMGMCEMAKQAMQRSSAPSQRVVPVTGVVPPFFRGRG